MEQKGSEYFLSKKQGGRWLSPVKVTPVSKADFEKMIKEPVTVSFVGLGNDNVAICNVPKGWKAEHLSASRVQAWQHARTNRTS